LVTEHTDCTELRTGAELFTRETRNTRETRQELKTREQERATVLFGVLGVFGVQEFGPPRT
jgi:hypothetical protein